jgi:transposase
MLRPSFIPPLEVRLLRDLTRDRADLVDQRTAFKNRVEKLLEDACVKLSVVATDIFGVSGRAMMNALIAGQRDPVKLADLAKAGLRSKRPALVEALNGFFTDHHGFRLKLMLDRVDSLNHDITALDQRIAETASQWQTQIDQLCGIPGVSKVNAAAILAEIGPDMSRFDTAGHLASWAKLAPGVNQSAGKSKGNSSTGKGNRYLARALGQSAVATRLTNTFLGQRYRRLSKRIGAAKAQVAVGRSMLVGIWHLLSNPEATWVDLGPDHHTQTRARPPEATHVAALQRLGYTVTLTKTPNPTSNVATTPT